jgi:hypothetical protein
MLTLFEAEFFRVLPSGEQCFLVYFRMIVLLIQYKLQTWEILVLFDQSKLGGLGCDSKNSSMEI